MIDEGIHPLLKVADGDVINVVCLFNVTIIPEGCLSLKCHAVIGLFNIV